MNITAFKAYDIRGRIPSELNSDISYAIGRAYAEYLHPQKVVVGHDIRLSSQDLSDSLVKGLIDGGAEVIDIGMCGTEMIYFATSHLKTDGGIMVTASHNPKEYNGMKLVREQSRPISGDTGLNDIRDLVASSSYNGPEHEEFYYEEKSQRYDIYDEYAKHVVSYINKDNLKPLKIVTNAGNGVGALLLKAISAYLPFEFININAEPDGNFPNGVPNPLLVENREATALAVREHHADFGIAWDGDADRCFLFDEEGKFIEGYYIVGLLAQSFLLKEKGAAIIHDPRLYWNTVDIVEKEGGRAVESKTGHAFIKERMRLENAVYGGEMSAHHYFRDFSYCDSGMLPWLLISELVCSMNRKLSEFVADSEQRYPISGEINRTVKNTKQAIDTILGKYESKACNVSHVDGISLEFENWRFNLRASNTEPVLRLNVESRGNSALVDEKTKEILTVIDSLS